MFITLVAFLLKSAYGLHTQPWLLSNYAIGAKFILFPAPFARTLKNFLIYPKLDLFLSLDF